MKNRELSCCFTVHRLIKNNIGGTAYTVKYAIKKKLNIFYISTY